MERGEMMIEVVCPSLSKAIQIVAVDDQKVDLGSIARPLGLDPNTLKLNGYFIARGPHHIASSLTWKSIIAFFSARRLPTGAAASAALLVDGKIASKRSHDVANVTGEIGCFRDSKRPQHDHCSRIPGLHKASWLCLKRKCWLEDEGRVKRARLDEGRFSCSIISKNLKRMRIDEIVAAMPLKKLR
ncbi:uncharacterized protein LOC131023531 isoform X2 [Salvia miltiorrhiza]|uniref:uncharacterized protein LOC131023531 isoform X2 n=1 Tax=Salvia miltiorrhiza TaxID=226208 RepID=UPI0025AC0F1A|nr:uncharacterized protein LOC131023531 isoform X2 [Salvia miltiorrhiza]